MGEGDENEHRLAQYLVPLVLRHVFDCPTVMQAISQFDQDYSDVIVKSKQDSFEILGLDAFGGCHGAAFMHFVVQYCLNLCQSVHEKGDMVTEQITYILYGVVGIFNHIVKQCRGNRFVAEAYLLHHDFCHLDGMKNVWFTGTAAYMSVSLVREIEGFADHSEFFFITAAYGRF